MLAPYKEFASTFLIPRQPSLTQIPNCLVTELLCLTVLDVSIQSVLRHRPYDWLIHLSPQHFRLWSLLTAPATPSLLLLAAVDLYNLLVFGFRAKTAPKPQGGLLQPRTSDLVIAYRSELHSMLLFDSSCSLSVPMLHWCLSTTSNSNSQDQTVFSLRRREIH